MFDLSDSVMSNEENYWESNAGNNKFFDLDEIILISFPCSKHMEIELKISDLLFFDSGYWLRGFDVIFCRNLDKSFPFKLDLYMF